MQLQKALNKYLQHLEQRDCSRHHLNTVRSRLTHFIRPRAVRDVASVTRRELHTYMRQLKSGRADATMAGYVATHRAFWKYCKKRKWTAKNPAKKLKSYSYDPIRRRAAPERDVQAVIDALPHFVAARQNNPRDLRDALIVSLSIDSGGRLGELRSLRKSDMRAAIAAPRIAENGRATYHVAASGKVGDVTLRFFQETADLAAAWLAVDTHPAGAWLFHNLRDGSPLRRHSVSRAFNRLCGFAGVTVFRSHALRKRNVTRIIRETGHTRAGQHYANHRSQETTIRHYSDVTGDDVDDAAARLASSRRDHRAAPEIERLFGLKK